MLDHNCSLKPIQYKRINSDFMVCNVYIAENTISLILRIYDDYIVV